MTVGNVGGVNATYRTPYDQGKIKLIQKDPTTGQTRETFVTPNKKQQTQEAFAGEKELLLDYYQTAIKPYQEGAKKGVHVTTIFDTNKDYADTLIKTERRLKDLGAI